MNLFVLFVLSVAFVLIAHWLVQRARHVNLANIAEGQRLTGNISKRSDGALGRWLMVKPGSDSDHVVVATATDSPYGVVTDEATAAEDPVNVAFLASANGTLKAVNDGTGALAFGDYLVPAAAGKVKKLAAGAGNYYIVGTCLQASTGDGDVFEFLPIGAWKTQ
jgi:hypothetical protein